MGGSGLFLRNRSYDREVGNKQAVMRRSRDSGLRNMDLLRFHLKVIIHAVVVRASISSRDALRYWQVALFPPD